MSILWTDPFTSTLVMLDGRASDDVTGDALSFAWREDGTLLGTNAQQVIGLGLGIHIITLEVTDPAGSSSQDTVVIAIEDTTPPVFGLVLDLTVECNHVPAPANITAIDACDPSPTIGFNEIQTPGKCPQSYTLTRIWVARDASGNSATNIQVITVQDTTPPVLSGQGTNQTISCPATPEFTAPTATDNCDPNPTITFTDATVPGASPGTYTTTRTWVAADHCGNISATVRQAITVQDITAPNISCPANRVVEFTGKTGAVVRFTALAAESCDRIVVAACVPESGSTFPIGTTLVHCTATDAASNSMTCEFTVTVLGAYGVETNVLAELKALRARVARPADLERLDRAIYHLTIATHPTRWRNENHPVPKHALGNYYLANETVLKLQRILGDRHNSWPDEVLSDWIARLVKANGLLAEVAVDDAAGAGGHTQRIARYRRMLAGADADAAAGRPRIALFHYYNAWVLATHLQDSGRR